MHLVRLLCALTAGLLPNFSRFAQLKHLPVSVWKELQAAVREDATSFRILWCAVVLRGDERVRSVITLHLQKEELLHR